MYFYQDIMYKKIALILLCLSPLLFAISIGYPIKTYSQIKKGGFAETRRCFKVGELEQFVKCLTTHERIYGTRLMRDVNRQLFLLFPFGNIIFFAALFGAVLILGLVIFFF